MGVFLNQLNVNVNQRHFYAPSVATFKAFTTVPRVTVSTLKLEVGVAHNNSKHKFNTIRNYVRTHVPT